MSLSTASPVRMSSSVAKKPTTMTVPFSLSAHTLIPVDGTPSGGPSRDTLLERGDVAVDRLGVDAGES